MFGFQRFKDRLESIFIYLPYRVFFNFYYLPFKQAIKFPISFAVKPKFIRLSGNIRIEGKLERGMIILGANLSALQTRSIFLWHNEGTIVFKGKCKISHHSLISCRKDAIIEFGNDGSFNFGLRIISQEKIVFGDKVRVSWDCTFIDTDFHPIIDMSTNKAISQTSSIIVDYGSWIGHNSIISKGARIPENSIVASGSVVKSKFKKKNTVIGGNPAIVLDDGYVRDDV